MKIFASLVVSFCTLMASNAMAAPTPCGDQKVTLTCSALLRLVNGGTVEGDPVSGKFQQVSDGEIDPTYSCDAYAESTIKGMNVSFEGILDQKMNLDFHVYENGRQAIGIFSELAPGKSILLEGPSENSSVTVNGKSEAVGEIDFTCSVAN